MEIELACAVVNVGVGSRVLSIVKRNGIMAGTVLLGKGTVRNRLLEILDINDVRKEIVMMIAEKTVVDAAMPVLSRELAFHKPHHGIAFTVPVLSLYGKRENIEISVTAQTKGEDPMFSLIYTIVEKGLAEDVVGAAVAAGARGGTIINARGSGIHETARLFAMDIEPEREIVMILCEKDLTETITASIREKLRIDEPGQGVVFVQEVVRTYGLY